jgi:abortive infection bacteriophage resistance protein
MRIQPMIPRNPRKPFINKATYIPSEAGVERSLNNKTYFILSMIIFLMNTINSKHNIQSKIESLFKEYTNIDARAMGFPDNWQDELLWQSNELNLSK